MTWQAISWSERCFAAYIQTAVRSARSHPPFTWRAGKLSTANVQRSRLTPSPPVWETFRLWAIHSWQQTEQGHGTCFQRPAEAGMNGAYLVQQWLTETVDQTANQCPSRGEWKREETGKRREEEEGSSARWSNPIFISSSTPFSFACLLSSSFTEPYAYLSLLSQVYHKEICDMCGTLLKVIVYLKNTNFCRSFKVWLLPCNLIAVNLNTQFFLQR